MHKLMAQAPCLPGRSCFLGVSVSGIQLRGALAGVSANPSFCQSLPFANRNFGVDPIRSP